VATSLAQEDERDANADLHLASDHSPAGTTTMAVLYRLPLEVAELRFSEEVEMSGVGHISLPKAPQGVTDVRW
jgi:predicted dinucleotide-binding enzyme